MLFSGHYMHMLEKHVTFSNLVALKGAICLKLSNADFAHRFGLQIAAAAPGHVAHHWNVKLPPAPLLSFLSKC